MARVKGADRVAGGGEKGGDGGALGAGGTVDGNGHGWHAIPYSSLRVVVPRTELMARPTTGCPIEQALLVLDGKWSVLIIRDLLAGPKRFGELRDVAADRQPEDADRAAAILEHQGVLTRTVYAEVPPRVVYELTERGQSFRSVLAAMAAWGERLSWPRTTARDPE